MGQSRKVRAWRRLQKHKSRGRYRTCERTGKRRFPDQKEAKAVRWQRRESGEIFGSDDLRIYECQWCHGWHFTSTRVE